MSFTRADLLSLVDQILDLSARYHNERKSGQVSLFDDPRVKNAEFQWVMPEHKRGSRYQELLWEKELLGIFFSAHPLDLVYEEIARRRWLGDFSSVDLTNIPTMHHPAEEVRLEYLRAWRLKMWSLYCHENNVEPTDDNARVYIAEVEPRMFIPDVFLKSV